MTGRKTKLILILLVCTVFFLPSTGKAADNSVFKNQPGDITVPDSLDRNLLTFGIEQHTGSAWQINAEYGLFSYRETGNSKENGSFCGARGAYLFKGEHIVLLSEARADSVGVKYTRESNSADKPDVDNFLLEGRQTVGITIPWTFTVNVIPYTGAGLRYYHDDLSAQITSDQDPLGVGKQSQYFYSPLGVCLTASPGNGWRFSLKLEYDHLWYGKQKNNWRYYYQTHPPADTYYTQLPEVVTRQDHGEGFRISVRIVKTGEKYNFSLEPFYNYWTIKDSQVKTFDYGSAIYSFMESKNNSKEAGLRVGVSF